MSVRVVAWAQDKGTHDAEVRPCRAQHLSQSSSPATNQSLLQFHSTAASWKMSTSHRFFSAGPFQELCTVECPLPPCPKYCLQIYPHQMTFDLFSCTKLLLLPNIITYYCFDEYHKYSTIIPHMLKYYYYYTKCSNTTIFIAQRDKSTKIDVGARSGARGRQLYVRVRDFGEWNLTFNLRK